MALCQPNPAFLCTCCPARDLGQLDLSMSPKTGSYARYLPLGSSIASPLAINDTEPEHGILQVRRLSMYTICQVSDQGKSSWSQKFEENGTFMGMKFSPQGKNSGTNIGRQLLG